MVLSECLLLQLVAATVSNCALRAPEVIIGCGCRILFLPHFLVLTISQVFQPLTGQ